MTPSDQAVRDAIAAQAAQWFVANRDGTPDRATQTAFLAWLRTSPVHVDEYLQITSLASDLRDAVGAPEESLDRFLDEVRSKEASSVVPFEPRLDNPTPVSPPVRRGQPQLDRRMAAAAAIVATIAILLAYVLHDGNQPHDAAIVARMLETTHGEVRAWTLDDGSTVRLNTDSAVAVHYSAHERLISVLQGQAAFSVVKEPARRFRVTSDEVSVVAVGTRFEVYRTRLNHAVVTVSEGVVAVDLRVAAPLTSDNAHLPVTGVRMRAGQQLRIDAGALATTPVTVDLQQVEAWQRGSIVFSQRPIREVAAEFNRYAAIPFTIEDPAVGELLISGMFDARDAESFVAFLATLDGVTVKRTATAILVIGKPGRAELPQSMPRPAFGAGRDQPSIGHGA